MPSQREFVRFHLSAFVTRLSWNLMCNPLSVMCNECLCCTIIVFILYVLDLIFNFGFWENVFDFSRYYVPTIKYLSRLNVLLL